MLSKWKSFLNISYKYRCIYIDKVHSPELQTRYKHTNRKKKDDEINDLESHEQIESISPYLACSNPKLFSHFNIDKLSDDMIQVTERLKQEIQTTIRIGKPSTSILKQVVIPIATSNNTNDSIQNIPLSMASSILVKDNNALVIKLYDPYHSKSLEKVLRQDFSMYTLNKENDTTFSLIFPKWTSEMRDHMLKQLSTMLESYKQNIRMLRRDAINIISILPQDEKRRASTEIQKKHDQFIKKLEDIIEEKKKHISN